MAAGISHNTENTNAKNKLKPNKIKSIANAIIIILIIGHKISFFLS